MKIILFFFHLNTYPYQNSPIFDVYFYFIYRNASIIILWWKKWTGERFEGVQASQSHIVGRNKLVFICKIHILLLSS